MPEFTTRPRTPDELAAARSARLDATLAMTGQLRARARALLDRPLYRQRLDREEVAPDGTVHQWITLTPTFTSADVVTLARTAAELEDAVLRAVADDLAAIDDRPDLMGLTALDALATRRGANS